MDRIWFLTLIGTATDPPAPITYRNYVKRWVNQDADYGYGHEFNWLVMKRPSMARDAKKGLQRKL